ncbi:MAG: hypothetical protein H6765_10520 [Candidatus Peribacteria bacterium]|nr:MAG: hypothetical protein H6765_10520 [Candidatus Peribacteria bacterium]
MVSYHARLWKYWVTCNLELACGRVINRTYEVDNFPGVGESPIIPATTEYTATADGAQVP